MARFGPFALGFSVAFPLVSVLPSIAAPSFGRKGSVSLAARRKSNCCARWRASLLARVGFEDGADRAACVHGDGQRRANGTGRRGTASNVVQLLGADRLACSLPPRGSWLGIWSSSTFLDVKLSVVCNRAVLFRRPSRVRSVCRIRPFSVRMNRWFRSFGLAAIAKEMRR